MVSCFQSRLCIIIVLELVWVFPLALTGPELDLPGCLGRMKFALLCKEDRLLLSDQRPGLLTTADTDVGITSAGISFLFPAVLWLPVFLLIWTITLVITQLEQWKEPWNFCDTAWHSGLPQGRVCSQTVKYTTVYFSSDKNLLVLLPSQHLERSIIK